MKIYIDGKLYSEKDARISVFDHGLLYGDGVFEGIRVYDGTVFKMDEHIERLYQSAKAILMDIPVSREEMKHAVLDTIKANRKKNGYIRLIVTRGKGSLGIDPSSCLRPSIIIIVGDIALYPEKFYTKGIPIITSSTRRIPPDGLEPRIKSLNYLNNVLARIEAKQAGCIEAVMLNNDGFVAECTVGNIFIAKNGSLQYPSPFNGSLDGITMQTVVEIAGIQGIETRATTVSRYDLYNADECFLTGTGAEIMPVIRIDGRVIGDGKPGTLTKKILSEFKLYVSGQ